MSDLLTIRERESAEAQGWQLCHVIDAKTQRVSVDILPTWQRDDVTSALAAQRLVVQLAKQLDGTALRALRLVVASRQGQTT